MMKDEDCVKEGTLVRRMPEMLRTQKQKDDVLAEALTIARRG